MDAHFLGWLLVLVGLGAGLLSLYCIYRLWEYGPYNTNLIFRIIDPFATWISIILVPIGAGLLRASWIVFLVTAVVYLIALRLAQSFYALRRYRQSEKQSRKR